MTAGEKTRMDALEIKVDNIETKVDDLKEIIHTHHTDTVREIRDVVEKALDRHAINCPMDIRVEKVEEDVQALESIHLGEKSHWDKWGPYLLLLCGFSLGAFLVSGVIPPAVLAAIIPF